MFSFDEQKTTELGAPFDAAEIDPAQKALLQDLTTMVAPALGLDPIPCHGLWLRAVRNWQAQHHRPATMITKMNRVDRTRSAIEIRDHFILLTRELLTSQDQRAALSKAIEDAFELYMQKYNRRPK